MKQLKLIIAALFLMSPFAANADIIFDFICDDGSCDADTDWGGFYVFSEESVANGAASGEDDILAFSFISDDKDGLIWTLAGLSTGDGHSLAAFTVTFNATGDLITSITGGSTGNCGSNAPCAAFYTGVDLLNTSAYRVDDCCYYRQESGTWVRRATVPEPGTLALLGLGLAGMGMTRRKKKA